LVVHDTPYCYVSTLESLRINSSQARFGQPKATLPLSFDETVAFG